MAANTFVVRLIDCATSGGVAGGTADVGSMLSTWYRAVCQQATSGSAAWSADVQWLAQPPSSNSGQDAGSPLTINLIIFYVPGPTQGVIRLHQSYRGTTLPAESDSGVWGTTVSRWTPPAARPGSRTPALGISEVYTSRCRGASDAETRLN